ncbi:MAG TPA: hypothetical protein VK586_14225, partial [Streptosporangiaceae bacterium]|nr:hypothetical protein [Streptosporangiaceae bacterium]
MSRSLAPAAPAAPGTQPDLPGLAGASAGASAHTRAAAPAPATTALTQPARCCRNRASDALVRAASVPADVAARAEVLAALGKVL